MITLLKDLNIIKNDNCSENQNPFEENDTDSENENVITINKNFEELQNSTTSINSDQPTLIKNKINCCTIL